VQAKRLSSGDDYAVAISLNALGLKGAEVATYAFGG
jgi:hypothetical protein